MKRFLFLIAAMCFTLTSDTARSGTIQYSWNGTITPRDPVIDPWDIGANGKRFEISVTLNETALDRLPDSLDASFEPLNAVLQIVGMPEPAFGEGLVFFQDTALRDSLDITLRDVEFNGVRETFFTGLNLPPTTFTLDEVIETPPVFPTAHTIFPGGAISESSSYRTFVPLDTSVTARLIPEPSTILLAVMASLGIGIGCWRNRVR